MNRSSYRVMSKLIGLVRPLAPFMALAVGMGVAGFLAAISITVLGAYAAMDALEKSGAVFVLCVIMAACAALRGFLRYAEQLCNHYIAFKLLALIRDTVFAAFRRLAPAKLEGRDKGNLISVITSDIELLEVFYAHTISPVCIACLVSACMTLWIGSFHIALGCIALAGYAVVGIVIPLAAARQTKKTGEAYRAGFGDINGYFLDSMRGLRESIQYNAGAKRLGEIERRTDALAASEKKLKLATGTHSGITGAAILGCSAATLFTAVWLWTRGALDLSGVVIPTVAIFSSFGPVIAVANLGGGLAQTIASGNRVLDILDDSPVVEEVREGASIRFDGARMGGVDFSYGGENVLRDFSIAIPKGKITGIVGKSGSGKSTMLRLFMRFWDAQKGSVEISGTALRQIRTDSLRKNESFVTQETHLFHDSIENNIRIAKLDASHDEIVAACKKASVHDFIMSLPDGYQSHVGELGDTLSGGERQRIGLARAFLHNAPFLLLDEPTSNLDSLNEAIILKALREDRARTTILVSHRASTMNIADEVHMMRAEKSS